MFPSIQHTSSGTCMGPKGHRAKRAIGPKGPGSMDPRAQGAGLNGPKGPRGRAQWTHAEDFARGGEGGVRDPSAKCVIQSFRDSDFGTVLDLV